jgi:hypothetical protein
MYDDEEKKNEGGIDTYHRGFQQFRQETKFEPTGNVSIDIGLGNQQ